MNFLDYRTNDDNGLSFELLVDEKSLGELIASQDSAIPYWLFEDDFPCMLPHSPECETDAEIRIVTVCSCGDYDCGHAECRVVRESDEVVFRDFDGDLTPKGAEAKIFRFAAENYDAVVAAILKEAKEFEAKKRG